jgi:hypothetical protein
MDMRRYRISMLDPFGTPMWTLEHDVPVFDGVDQYTPLFQAQPAATVVRLTLDTIQHPAPDTAPPPPFSVRVEQRAFHGADQLAAAG